MYLFAAANHWTEVVDAARSKIVSNMVDGTIEKLEVVAISAYEIGDFEMWKFWVKKSGYPEEAFL